MPLMVMLVLAGLFPFQLSAQPLAQGKERFLGCGTSSDIQRILNSYWNQVTPGNAGKWGSVSPVRGQYNWFNLDTTYNYATRLGLLYKHHTLVWGAQQPGWISGLDSATQRTEVENWIRLVGQRYPKMNFVDVVNEPLHQPPPYMAALGGSGTTGWDWVITAFQLARQYCAPGVKLILNEYNVLGTTANADTLLTIVNLLKTRNLIDGIGVQGHYFEFRSHIGASGSYVYNLNDIRSNLSRLTATGIPVYITEFDIDEPVDSDQLAQYQIYFPILWTNTGVKGITFWGYIENDVWSSFPNTYLLHSDGRERPAMQWLRTYVNIPVPPTLVSPVSVNGTLRNPQLVWQSSVLATSYHVQVADNRAFAPLTIDTTVADTTLKLNALAANTRYYWRVAAANASGASDYATMVSFLTGEVIAEVEWTGFIPDEYFLSQNYPNPFNPTTAISFQLSAVSYVTLRVFDPLGREVGTLVDQVQPSGRSTVHWNASGIGSGVYFCLLDARSVDGSKTFTAVRKLLLMK